MQKASTSASLTILKYLTVNQHKLWKIPKEMGIPDHLTCLLRNLYAGQEATVEPDMEQWTVSKMGKDYVNAVYAELIMQNARVDEAQAGIKIAGRNINNLRYADETILTAKKSKRTKEPLDESERGE